ncbi:MAG: sulfate/thiosulfate transport system permease protein [Actinomycetota bacterium]|nr:sulfate/thiosulfate transport system permease protein [Actinomycetota bacterium]
MGKWIGRIVALAYLMLLLIVPVGIVFFRTFRHGFSPFWDAITTSHAEHAFRVTLEVAIFAVIGNTVFGLIAAMLLARHRFPGRAALNALIDLPLAVSPVVVGLALILVYGRFEPIGRFLDNHGIKVIFSLPGMVLATIFVSLPLLARELVPVLEEIGIEQEQAAWTLGASGLQTFRRITLPAIRWALAYGVVLTLARALGEFGAVAVVSGGLVGKTQTLTLYVQQEFQNFDPIGAYAASFVLAVIAIVVLIIINVLRPKEHS